MGRPTVRGGGKGPGTFAQIKRYLPEASVAAGILAAAGLPVTNTYLSLSLAPLAVTLGLAALAVTRPERGSIGFKAAVAGVVLGALVGLAVFVLHYLAGSAAGGRPL